LNHNKARSTEDQSHSQHVPASSSEGSTKSGSTDSTRITFPPLAGNVLKQLRKIVTHSESFQPCNIHCKSAQYINNTQQELNSHKEGEREENTRGRRRRRRIDQICKPNAIREALREAIMTFMKMASPDGTLSNMFPPMCSTPIKHLEIGGNE
jgi:hypothetical protein